MTVHTTNRYIAFLMIRWQQKYGHRFIYLYVLNVSNKPSQRFLTFQKTKVIFSNISIEFCYKTVSDKTDTACQIIKIRIQNGFGLLFKRLDRWSRLDRGIYRRNVNDLNKIKSEKICWILTAMQIFFDGKKKSQAFQSILIL